MNEIYQPEHWHSISKLVSNIALPIFPHIKGKKLKSAIMSNLYETQSAKYFNSINIPTKSAQNDREPDLLFTDHPVEIKVSGVDDTIISNPKWMGGKYSKRESDYIFILWHYQPMIDNYIVNEPECLSFAVIQCYATIEDWKTIDNNNDNYYATVMTLQEIYDKPHRVIIGNRFNYDGIICKPCDLPVDNFV